MSRLRVNFTCTVEGCGKPAKTKGLCLKHYTRYTRSGDPTITKNYMDNKKICEVEGCDNPYSKRGLCGMHYAREKNYGRLFVVRAKGANDTPSKYKSIRYNGQVIMEHIHKAEQALGKKLPAKAVVHHVNGNGRDNRNSNLVVCPSQEYHLLLHRRAKELGIVFD